MCFGERKVAKHLIIQDNYQRKKPIGVAWLFAAGLLLVGSLMLPTLASANDGTSNTSPVIFLSGWLVLFAVTTVIVGRRLLKD